jgi:antagonist of KipI
VGNSDRAAVLELTLKGPELQFEQNTVIAITGADLSPTINGGNIPRWESIVIPKNSRLRFGTPRTGSRAYLAIAGGIDVPLVLGSRSTHCASETGGFAGRQLKQGDVLCSGKPGPFVDRLIGTRLPIQLLPRYTRPAPLRIMPGPQQNFFSERSFSALTTATYTVSPQSDRMGYRLTGPKIVRKGSTQFISDSTAMGVLQVPSDGQPILLMADRQTTGGYPKIAVVISADLSLAAQLAPGDSISFIPCAITQAQTALRQQRAQLDAALRPQDGPPVTK